MLQGCATPSIVVTREQQQGDYHNNQNNYEQAIIHYKKSLEASARLGIYRNPLMQSQLCRKIAHAKEAMGNYTEALVYINKSNVFFDVFGRQPLIRINQSIFIYNQPIEKNHSFLFFISSSTI